jgi:hypothetical protein
MHSQFVFLWKTAKGLIIITGKSMNSNKKRTWRKNAALAAFALMLIGTAFSSCQREACPGAITQTELEQQEVLVLQENELVKQQGS